MALPQLNLKKQQIILIGGVVLAVVSLLMIKSYVEQQRAAAEESVKEKYKEVQANSSPVLVAKKDIGRGEMINPDSLAVEVIPNKFVQPQAVTSMNRISGMSVIAPISKGEQITLGKLAQQRGGQDLAAATPAGKRAITIMLDDVASFGGMIKAGNYVDVLSMVPVPVQTADGKSAVQMSTIPLFQNILVLAVGQDIGAESAGSEGRKKKETSSKDNVLVTLALSPQEANITAFVQEQGGKLRLTLRSPSDAKVEPVQLVTWDSLFQYLMPQREQQQSKEALPPPPQEEYVEVYRGTNKENVPLAK